MKKLTAVTLALFAAVSLSACNSAPAPAAGPDSGTPSDNPSAGAYSTTAEDIKARGELLIGLDDTFAPMGFRDENETLVGFDIDLANAVCKQLGVKATFVPIDWNAKEMELAVGNIDCIWNGMSATAERKESMSLSQNYLNNKIIIMTNEGVSITSKQDLANCNISVQAGSAAFEALQADEIYSVVKDKTVEFPTYDEAILDMLAGRSDVMIIDEVFGNYKNSKLDKKFLVSEVDFGDDLYAIGFRKGDTDLTNAVNNALSELVKDGSAKAISEVWFGTDLVIAQ